MFRLVYTAIFRLVFKVVSTYKPLQRLAWR